MVHPSYIIKESEAGGIISHYHPAHLCAGCPHCEAGVSLERRPFLLNSNTIPGILYLTGWTVDEDGNGEQAPV